MHIMKTHVRAAWHFLLTRHYSTNRLSKIIALSGRFSMDLCKTISESNPTCRPLFGNCSASHGTTEGVSCDSWMGDLNGLSNALPDCWQKKKLAEIWGVWIYLSLLSFSTCLCVKAWHLWHDFWGPALCACFLLVTSWATTPSPSPMQMIFGSSEGMWGYVGMECPGTWEKWEEHCVFWMPNANLTRSALTTIHCHQSWSQPWRSLKPHSAGVVGDWSPQTSRIHEQQLVDSLKTLVIFKGQLGVCTHGIYCVLGILGDYNP